MIFHRHTYTILSRFNKWRILLWLIVTISLASVVATDTISAKQVAGTEPNGVGVFGDVLGIHYHHKFAAAGDVLLIKTHITGNGTFVLSDWKPQRLAASQSSINNLEISNPTRVTVRGDLRIAGKVTVKHGTLDASAATLTLGDSSEIHLLMGGSLIKPAGFVARQPAGLTIQAQHWPVALAALGTSLPTPHTSLSGQKIFDRIISTTLRLPNKELFPPPEIAASLFIHTNNNFQ